MAALIRYANETTGESDSTLSEAIDSLVAGYGGGGGAYILIYSTPGALLSCGLQQYTLQANETYHAFPVTTGTYTCTASLRGLSNSVIITVTSDTVYVETILLARLPEGYTEVEYLRSTGTQFIDTGKTFTVTDEVHIVGENMGSGDTYLVAPSAWNDNNNRFAMIGGDGSRTAGVGFGNFSTNTTILTPSFSFVDFMMDVWYRNKIFTSNNPSGSSSFYDGTSASFGGETYPLRLFYGYIWPTPGKIMAYQHYRGGSLIIDLVPCYRNSDNKPGMYDLVSGGFFVNQGSNEFILGPTV